VFLNALGQNRFPSVLLQPLGHLSVSLESTTCERSRTDYLTRRRDLHSLLELPRIQRFANLRRPEPTELCKTPNVSRSLTAISSRRRVAEVQLATFVSLDHPSHQRGKRRRADARLSACDARAGFISTGASKAPNHGRGRRSVVLRSLGPPCTYSANMS
jgi:hypothetical protein